MFREFSELGRCVQNSFNGTIRPHRSSFCCLSIKVNCITISSRASESYRLVSLIGYLSAFAHLLSIGPARHLRYRLRDFQATPLTGPTVKPTLRDYSAFRTASSLLASAGRADAGFPYFRRAPPLVNTFLTVIARPARLARGRSSECLSIIAVRRIVASGLAMSLPAVSVAEPPDGSNNPFFVRTQ